MPETERGNEIIYNIKDKKFMCNDGDCFDSLVDAIDHELYLEKVSHTNIKDYDTYLIAEEHGLNQIKIMVADMLKLNKYDQEHK
ncbi:MAG: hypothetical protein ACYCS1_05290 [Gammaproteobacteria bacterium]